MIVNITEIKACLDKATEMSDAYKLNVLPGDRFPRSVDDLRWVCETHLGYKIKAFTLDQLPSQKSGQSMVVRGLTIVKDGQYEIYIHSDMEPDWNRFVLCKELFHVLLDDEKYRKTDIFDHLEEIATAFVEATSRPSVATVAELMAEIAAMEFLFPYEKRLIEQGDGSGKPDYEKIAKYFEIPQYLIEKYMTESLMKTLGAFFVPPSQKK